MILSGKSQELLLIYENIYLKALVSQSVSREANYDLVFSPRKGLQGHKDRMRWALAGRYLLDHSNVCRAPNSYSRLDSSRREQEESISSHTKLILEPQTFTPCSPLRFFLFLMFVHPPTIPFIFKCLLFVPASPLSLPVSTLMMSPEKRRWRSSSLLLYLISGKFSLPCSHAHAPPPHTHTHALST